MIVVKDNVKIDMGYGVTVQKDTSNHILLFLHKGNKKIRLYFDSVDDMQLAYVCIVEHFIMYADLCNLDECLESS